MFGTFLGRKNSLSFSLRGGNQLTMVAYGGREREREIERERESKKWICVCPGSCSGAFMPWQIRTLWHSGSVGPNFG